MTAFRLGSHGRSVTPGIVAELHEQRRELASMMRLVVEHVRSWK
jgi:hypothetical protein